MTEPPDMNGLAHHQLAVHGRIGTLELNFEADFTAPWTVLFGPSGCGKSTLLRALCGLTAGLQVFFTRTQTNAALAYLQGNGRSIPTEKRELASAPQQAVLFPHLTVRENVAFGEAVRPKREASPNLVEEAMALFDLKRFASRKPRELSGGERQRVSLARALAVPGARLALLDEPFAGVDRALRDELLPRVRQWYADRAIPVLSVTHDVDEVFLLRAEVVRLRDGRAVAQGPPQATLADEAARVLRALNHQSLDQQHLTNFRN